VRQVEFILALAAWLWGPRQPLRAAV